MKNICVVTGTRAEYGLLSPLLDEIKKSDDMFLRLVVTGMHLSPEFGLTYQEIEKDGYRIDKKIEMLLSADTPGSILKSMGIEIIGFADYLAEKPIDLMVLLGDRFETFVAAASATVYGIPIAHIHGGESTEGAIDEAFRHSITKMSMLHFTATEEYRRRVIQMGEWPDKVFNVGSLGIEKMKRSSLLARTELEKFICLPMDAPFFVVTFHPVTLEKNTARQQMENLLLALDHFNKYNVIFTKANSDMGGRVINRMIDEYVEVNKHRCVSFVSMGQLRYWSVMQYCVAVIGNSSSGVIEAPSFNIPTVDIGDRQKGRMCADSVIHCKTGTEDIRKAISQALCWKEQKKQKIVINPYEKKGTVKEILEQIRKYLYEGHVGGKKFFNI